MILHFLCNTCNIFHVILQEILHYKMQSVSFALDFFLKKYFTAKIFEKTTLDELISNVLTVMLICN